MSQPTSPTTHYLLIEQPRIAEAPRSTMLMPATELAQMFSRADREAMARGEKVQIGAVSYTDLLAYHDAQEFLKRLAARDKAAPIAPVQPRTAIAADFDWDIGEPCPPGTGTATIILTASERFNDAGPTLPPDAPAQGDAQ